MDAADTITYNSQWMDSSARRDLRFLAIFGTLAVAFSYFAIQIPHTQVHLDIRYLFGYVGAVLIRRKLPAALVIAAPALAGFHDVPLWVAFVGNLSYAIPTAVGLRLLHRRYLQQLESAALYGLGWFLGLAAAYQLIVSPVIWAIRGMLESRLSLSFVLDVYRTQPFLFESCGTGAHRLR